LRCVTSRLFDPVGLEGVVAKLERLGDTLAARHRAVTAALALADRPIGSIDRLVVAADEAEWWVSVLRDRIEWAKHHDPFAGSGALVDGLAVPSAVVGDVGGNGSASGWELPGVSTMWQPWRSFGQHARQAVAQGGLEWPDHRPPLSTVLGPIGSLLAEVSGAADAKRCIQGSLPDCGWFAAGLVPWGRMARIAHLARHADEAGGVVVRVGQEILAPRRLTIDDLFAAARVPKRGGFSVAGHSLTKHGRGARPGNQLFPEARGNPAEVNETAQRIVDEILTHPDAVFLEDWYGRFGDVIEVTVPDGRTLVYSSDGRFIFFGE
jgi:hypothetical protein